MKFVIDIPFPLNHEKSGEGRRYLEQVVMQNVFKNRKVVN